MAQVKAQFGPYNDELPPSGLKSGVAIDMLNTVIDSNTVIGGRLGFDVWDNNTGPKGNILSMFVATFSNGDVFVVTKRSDKKLYHWKAYDGGGGAAATAWTEIKNKWPSNLHATAERGWFFMWADRMYFVDSVGGTKWDGTEASSAGVGVYKSGIESKKGPVLLPIAGGGKEGWYHVTATNLNVLTGEEGCAGAFQSGGAAETRLSAASAEGGLRISNWVVGDGTGVTDETAAQDFEFNAHSVYCSLGNSERIGLGAGVEQFSYQMYLEDSVFAPADLESAANFDGIFRMDGIMARKPMLTNLGGQPPGASYGCFNGSQAIYLEVYPKADGSPLLDLLGAGTLAPGVMMYSVPGFPAMVPQVRVYDIAGVATDGHNFVPQGGANEIPTSIAGLITGCGTLGNSFLVFTNSSTYSLTPNSQGNMRPLLADSVHGAIGYNPVVSTGASVHTFGKDVWLRIGNGIQNIAHEQFTPTMEAIPDGGIAATTGGHYSHRDEVWFAVAKVGGTKAQRILIWSERKQELVAKFDPANLSTAGIKAMVELSHPKQTPIMLVALDTGVILQWPGTLYVDEVTGGDNLAYACNWKGVYGQEQRANDGYIKMAHVSMEMIPATGVDISVAGIESGGEASTASLVDHTILPWTNSPNEIHMERVGEVYWDPTINGNMFVVELSSTAAQGADWKVVDLVFEIDRINRS